VNQDGQSPAPCPYCGALSAVVFVHGHGQCSQCGVNTEPCCGGAAAQNEVTGGCEAATPDPGLFARLFVALGGPTATVTTESLLHAIVQSQDCDLDEARLVVEAGERIGLVVRAGAGLHRLRRGPAT
jgi:hypothetical protein